jgi:hypothetical protein
VKTLLSSLFFSVGFVLPEPALVAQAGGVGSAFITCSLRHQIELDLPATWEIVGASTLAELRNAAHAKIDLAKLPVKQLGGYEALLVSHGTTEDSFIMVTVTYKAAAAPTQSDVTNWSSEQVAKWSHQSESELKSAASMIKGFVWGSANRRVLGSQTFLQTNYERTHQVTRGQVAVSIYNYFDDEVVQITTTFPTQDRLLWEPIAERIVSSMRLIKK